MVSVFQYGSALECCYRDAALAGREPPSSSGLGRRPFKAVTRVRIPLGVQGSAHRFMADDDNTALRGSNNTALRGSNIMVPWCSLECTPACQAGGRGFKSRRDRTTEHGRVAQLAERPPEKRKVTGSTPVPTTTHPPTARSEAQPRSGPCPLRGLSFSRSGWRRFRGSCGRSNSRAARRKWRGDRSWTYRPHRTRSRRCWP